MFEEKQAKMFKKQEKPRNDYKNRLEQKRRERDALLHDISDTYLHFRNVFIEIEREIVELSTRLNERKFMSSNDRQIKYYLKYYRINHRNIFSVIKELRIEYFDSSGRETKRRDLARDNNTTRYVKRVVSKNFLSEYTSIKSRLISQYRLYSKLAVLFDSINAELEKVVFPLIATKHLPLRPESDQDHFLNPKAFQTALDRSVLMSKMGNKITYTAKQLRQIEEEIDEKVATFNFKFKLKGQGLIYSWELKDLKCAIRSIFDITLSHIKKPINERGERFRFKSAHIKLTREFLRLNKFKRFEHDIMKSAREIRKLGDEYLAIKVASVKTKSILLKINKLIN